jgi:hypothetical protein
MFAYLVKCGVLRPVVRTNADTFFAFPDLAVIKQANEGLEHGIAFRSIVRTMLASRQGQLEFDFRSDAAPAKIITLRRPAREHLPPNAAAAAANTRLHDTQLQKNIFESARRSTTATTPSSKKQRRRIARRWSWIRICAPP